MKAAYFELSLEFLAELLRGQATPYTTSLPPDTKVEQLVSDNWPHRTAKVMCSSESFDDVPEGAPLPQIVVALTRQWPQPAK